MNDERSVWERLDEMKDVYASMAPSVSVRGLGSTQRVSGGPRNRDPQIRRAGLDRHRRRRGMGWRPDTVRGRSIRSKKSAVERLTDARETWEIYRAAVKTETVTGGEMCLWCKTDLDDYELFPDGPTDLVVCKDCYRWADLESKGAPSRMPAKLRTYWAYGAGRARWANNPHPYRTLRGLLRRYGVPGRMVDGATANVMHAATGIYPGQRPEVRGRRRR